LVVSINGIKCPICGERLTGNDPEELNYRLRMHMADLHQMKELSTPMREGAATQPVSFAGPESRAEREVTTFSGSGGADAGPRSTEQRQEVTQFRDTRRRDAPLENQVTTFNRNEPPTNERANQEADQWKYSTGPETRTERQVETFSGRDPSMRGGDERLRAEEVNEWKYPRTGPAGERGPISEVRHGGGMGHRMMNRRPMTLQLNCPICGNAVHGSDDEDLSDELRFHFRDVHNLRRR
jgi:predicted small metal-binding protein